MSATDGGLTAQVITARQREFSRDLTAVFGSVVGLLMRSDQYREFPLEGLEWLLLPAIDLGQVAIANVQPSGTGFSVPYAAVIWASVSAEVEAKLEAVTSLPCRLEPRDWSSGDKIWIIEAVGEPGAVKALLDELVRSKWKGKRIRIAQGTRA